MIYVFDTSSLIVLGNYYPARFPTFWSKFNDMVVERNIISVRESEKELDTRSTQEHLRAWVDSNKQIFLTPNPEETAFVGQIFAVPKFINLVKERVRLAGGPAADPFIIAAAKVKKGVVVTQEKMSENAIKIPNVCEHFSIDCINLETMMEREGWVF